MLFDAAADEVRVLCGQGPMPAAATIDRFRGLGLDSIPGSGLLPACVPGAFGAWLRLLREHGRLSVSDVLEPAIGYAEHGFPLLPKAAAMIQALVPLFRDHWTGSGATYLRNGAAPTTGDRQRNPALARTFRRILREAASAGGREAQVDAAIRAFYQGFVAEAIDRFVADTDVLDATGRPNRGLLTGADLSSWRPAAERPVSLDYRGCQVYKPGPWSQGPVFLQQLALLSGFDLRAMGFAGAEHIHTVVESAKLAFADREAWYGDPDHADVPLAELLDPAYTAARRALIGAKASGELRPGRPGGRLPVVPELPGPPVSVEEGWRAQLRNGLPTVLKRTVVKGDTTTITATDREGNMVVATPSGGWLASSPVVPELGFPLGTRGQIASLTDGIPNSLAPGKRPRTTLSPTIVRTDDGRPYLAFGTPGGDRQDQWTLNFFLNHIDFGLSPQEAVEAATFHTDHVVTSFTPRQYRPRSLVVERDVDVSAVTALRARGHRVDLAETASLGQVCVTGPREDGGVFAAASHRGQQAYGVVR